MYSGFSDTLLPYLVSEVSFVMQKEKLQQISSQCVDIGGAGKYTFMQATNLEGQSIDPHSKCARQYADLIWDCNIVGQGLKRNASCQNICSSDK